MNIFNIVMFSVVALWLLIASCFDFKTREVPDWLNYSLIFFGFSSRIIYSLISWDFWYLLYGIFGFVFALVIGLIMSYGKQWGDGDSKMIVGIGTCVGFSFGFSFFDFNSWPFMIYFLLNSLFVGAVYGLIWSISLGIIHFKEFVKETKKWNRKIFYFPLIFGVLLGLFSFLFFGIMRMVFIISLIGLIVCIYVLILVKIIEKACMFKRQVVWKLVPGDWVAEVVKFKGKIICSSKDRCLDEEQIKLLKKYKIKDVLIKEGIPFVPAFFFGFIFSLIWGNILVWLI